MEISINNYNDLSSYNPDFEDITLGYEFRYAWNILQDKDFDTFISDTIIHESIHEILYKQFGITISKLFDTVEHFISNMDIKEKVFNNIRINKQSSLPMTWHDSITMEGFNAFLKHYHIDKPDLIQAYIITGGK